VRGLLSGDPLERGGTGPRPLAACASLCLHGCVIAILAVVGAVSRPSTREVTTIFLQHEKLVWYFTKDRLPEVAPDERQRAGKPKVQLPRPRQVIIADTLRPQGKQLIWQPAPKLELEHETPLPNLLAFVPKPARPEPRKFVPPKLPKTMEDPPRALPEPVPLAVAPAAAVPLPLAEAIPGPAKPRPRAFMPPVEKAGQAQAVIVLEAAPNVAVETRQPSVVVVGLEPARTNEIPLPEGSRAPRFSAGPNSGPGGGERTAAITVPGLTVHGNGTDSAVVVGPARKAPLVYHEPSTAEWEQATAGKDSRRVARSMMSAALRPSARVLAPVVEARFPNRPVYTTSFEVGTDGLMEWVIWFADQNGREGQYVTIRPPVPWTRVGTGPDGPLLPPGRFEVAAVIDKAGQLSSVTVLNGGDQAAKEAAVSLVAEWAFLPALRNGEPIAVDTLIEIRFRRRP
jgi:Gram-negative bacterial TonB protein C-terminal